MKTVSMIFKAVPSVAALLLALTLSNAHIAEAASSTIIVANTANPIDCGKYKTATSTDLATTLNTVKKGKVLICPGTYNLNGSDIFIDGAKGLTIAQAVVSSSTGPETRPVLVPDAQSPSGISIKDSTNVTLSGLIINNSASLNNGNRLIEYDHSSGKVMSSLLFGTGSQTTTPRTAIGIAIGDTHPENKTLSVSVSNTSIYGYTEFGILVQDQVRANITSAVLNATDGGRLPPSLSTGVAFMGGAGDKAPEGSLTKSAVYYSANGVYIREASKISISNNQLIQNNFGIVIESMQTSYVTSDNKITGNTITGIPDDGRGIFVYSIFDPADLPMLKNTISKNVIETGVPLNTGYGILILAPGPSLKTMTGTVTGNTVSGFSVDNSIANWNSFAGFKIKGNQINSPQT